MTRKRRIVTWAVSAGVALYFALFGTLFEWVQSVWPGAGVSPPREHHAWGVAVLWIAFTGCVTGLWLEARNPVSRRTDSP